MCAVIGVMLKSPSNSDLETVRRIFLQSKIRGMHATGMSVVIDGKIQTFKEEVSADKFSPLDDLENMINEDGNLYLIGHCRYSTSDLQYNQPMAKENSSIVHNGVITQELPEKWKEIYGWDLQTKNDSELILFADNPLERFPSASMGVCELYLDKTMRVYRNGKRPLYLTNLVNGVIITSTLDIPKRSGIEIVPEIVPMNTYLTMDILKPIKAEAVQTFSIDYQQVDYDTKTILN